MCLLCAQERRSVFVSVGKGRVCATMSVAGGGLCFLIRVPTEEYEKDILESRRRTPVSTPTTDTQNELNTTNNKEKTESSDDTEVKSRFLEPLEKVLRKSLEELNVYDAIWVLDKDEKYYQVSFTCSPGLPSDLILTSLATNGIGMCKGSSLIVMPCTVWLQDEDDSSQGTKETTPKFQFICEDERKSESDVSTLSKTKSEMKKAFRNFKDMQKKFLQTVTARLTVAQVVDGVRAGAQPTFDFIMFVLIASMISALGLLENSSVIIVASMLISPLMGPIMAGTFGAVIRDRSLRNLGIQTEILGLFLCVFIGFVFGLSSEAINAVWGRREWPNSEMISRGQERSLWVGVLIALPSGAGVALSVLGGNAGSLVGVAISASLLPPAVNAGLLWGMATVKTIRSQDESYQFIRVEGVMRLMKPSLIPYMNYEMNYYPEMDSECAMLGVVSLGLTLINILCIFLAALVVLKIKEVAPKTSMSRTSRFWKEDIKIARDYNSSSTVPVSETELGNQFIAEWATLNGLEPEELLSDDAEATITRMETLKDIMQDVESDEVFQTVARSVSSTSDPRPLSQRLSIMPLSPNLPPSTTSPKAGRRSGVRSWLQNSLPSSENGNSDIHLSPELKDVELRRPHPQNLGARVSRPLPGTRSSVAVLRQSLMNADNPYTLWPSAARETANKVRFLVTPVEESLPPLSIPKSPTRRRVSKFLQDPCMVIKETTC